MNRQLLGADFTRLEMGLDLLKLLTVQCVQRIQGNQFDDLLVLDHVATPSSSEASFFIPLLMRLFTVPSGAPSLFATST